MKLDWNFQRGGEWSKEKNPFCRGGMDIWIFSGTTQWNFVHT